MHKGRRKAHLLSLFKYKSITGHLVHDLQANTAQSNVHMGSELQYIASAPSYVTTTCLAVNCLYSLTAI